MQSYEHEKEMQSEVDALGGRDQFGDIPLMGNVVPDDLLDRIRQNESTLSVLHLDFYDLDDAQIKKVCDAMKNNTHVKKIIVNAPHKNIAYGRLSALSAKLLSELNIDCLWMVNQPIGDDGAKYLANSKFIKDMFICSCNISLQGAQFFLLSESLQEINLNIDDWQGQRSHFDDRIDLVLARNKARVHPEALSEFRQDRHARKIEETVVRIIEQDAAGVLSRLILQLQNGVNSIVAGSSLLMWCVSNNAVNCLEYLLKAGVLLEQHEREYTALFEAAEQGKLEVVCLLLPYCANLTGEFYFNSEKPISAVASKLLNELYAFFEKNTERQSRLDKSFTGLLNKFLQRWEKSLSAHATFGQVFWEQVSLEDDLLYQFPMYTAVLLAAFKPTEQEKAAVERIINYSYIYKLLRKKEGIVTGKHVIDYPKYYTDLKCKVEDHHVEMPVRSIPPSRLTKEELENTVQALNDDLSTLEESDIDWDLYPKLFIAEYRGVHYSPEYFTEEQIQDDLYTCHLNRYAPAPAVMMMSDLFPRQLQVARESMVLDNSYRLRDEVEGFRQSGAVRLFGQDYVNAQFALQERATNFYNAYNADVSNGANEQCIILRDMKAKGYLTYAMSDFPRHAIRYAANLKNYQNNIYAEGGGKKALANSGPKYDTSGKPERIYLGKIYISLFTPLQMAQHRLIHVAGAHNRKRMNIDDKKAPERETGSPGGVNQSCLFYEAILEIPDFSQSWTQAFVEKFNIDAALHLHYLNRFRRGMDTNAVMMDLMEHIVKHKTRQSFDLALKEAKRRGGYLIFKHYLGQYGLLPEGMRNSRYHPTNPYKEELEVIQPSWDKQFSTAKNAEHHAHRLRMFGQVKRERDDDAFADTKGLKKEKRNTSQPRLTMTDPGYWYSIHDGICLLRNLRGQFVLLDELRPDRNHPYRQNNRNLFLADPYHHSNFENYFHDDISRLTADGNFNRIQPWTQMPTRIVIPILVGAHWICVRIELNYNNLQVSTVWQDPFGDSCSINDVQQQFSHIIKQGCLRLMQHQNSKLKLNIENITFDEQICLLDQQGYGINGSDCGVIVFSNIRDFVMGRSLSIPSYDTEGHDEIIRQQREADSQVVGDDAFDDDNIAVSRIMQLEADQLKCREERLKQKFASVMDQQIMREVQILPPELIDVFFGYLDIYKSLVSAYDEFVSDMNTEYEPRSELRLN